MATVTESAPGVEESPSAPDAADSEQGAEEVRKTVISLSELVDLALCTPEPGAVNFNLLRAVLHALVQRLDLVDIKAEILDEDTDKVFSQIMENAEKLGLKDLRARQTGSSDVAAPDQRRARGESRERHHKSRHSDRSRGSSEPGGAQRDAVPGGGGSGAPAADGRRQQRSDGGGGGGYSDGPEGVGRPESAGDGDLTRSRSLSGERLSPRDGEDPAAAAAAAAVTRRAASVAGEAAAASDPGQAGTRRPVGAHTSSSDSLVLSSGLSSGSDAESAGRHARKATLSELASERLRRTGRQSAVSISSHIEGAAVLADYTNLDRLEKKMTDMQQKMEVMELADMLPKVRELQSAISGSQEDVQGLWQSLQLMKKVDANEEGIDKLTQVIETAMTKLKKVRKHTDRLDKQLADMVGHKSSQHKSKGEERQPVTLVEMETKYNEIRSVIDGLLSSLGQEPSAATDAEEDSQSSEQKLRSVGAGIVTWSVLESALENIRGEVKEMSEVNDQALSTVERQQTETRQEELKGTAAMEHTTQASKVKQLLANLSRLVDKHRSLEKRVLQMEESMGDNFSDKVLEQLTLLKASATQIQDLRNKLSSGPRSSVVASAGGGGGGGMAPGWSDLDVAESAASMGHMVSDDLSLNLTSLREPSQMDLNHLSDWLNYNKARMEQLEKALVSQSEQVRDFGDRLGDQVVSFRDKLERVERELAGMLGRLTSAAQKAGMSREDSQALHDAYAKIQTLQMDVEALSSISKKIVSDRGQLDDELSMLIRALEELKECKVDRATLDELIETKADRSSVEKKVSSWQFEQACQELSEGLGSMLDKMGSQEVDWVRSVDEINADLHRKLDRVELAPLRRYVNVRLKNIMAKLNRLIAEDESPDACTTRRKLIRNLNCLSCDDPKKISGRPAVPTVPLLAPFPPSTGGRHLVSYRLGAIRRHQQMRSEPYKDLTGHQGVFRSHIQREVELMTHDGIPHHPNCPLYQNRAPHGRCSCVATRFCGGSHTKIDCVDTRRRRIGLGAPLLPFGVAVSGPPADGRTDRERLARVSSSGGRRPGSRSALLRPSPAGSGPRQVRSAGSGLRQKRDAAAGGLGAKSAPEFSVPFEVPDTKPELELEQAGPKTEPKIETGGETTAESATGDGETEGVETKTEPKEETLAPSEEETKTEPKEETQAAAKEETKTEPKGETQVSAEGETEASSELKEEKEEGGVTGGSPSAEEEAPPGEVSAPLGETETGETVTAEEGDAPTEMTETAGAGAAAAESTGPGADTETAAPAEGGGS